MDGDRMSAARPCSCDTFTGPALKWDREGGNCRECYLYHRDPRYRALWGGNGTAPLGRTLPCVHRGDLEGQVPCEGCKGRTSLKVFACDIHSRCVLGDRPAPGAHACGKCTDYEPAPLGPRNLLFHLYPVAEGGRWRWHAERLRRYINLFDGRKVLALALDGRTSPEAEVRGELAGLFDEVLTFRNDSALREVVTFEALLSRVESRAPGEVTLYAHGKSTHRHAHHPAYRWAEALWEVCTDWPAVEAALRSHPVAGAFKKVGRGWPAHESRSDWHYSGSWFWFRNADLFSRDWRRIDRFWSGVEPYPSLHFRSAEAACLFHEGKVGAMDLYREDYWNRSVIPELNKWRVGRAMRTEGVSYPELRVELGGGEHPRAGFVQVDKVPYPGVKHVLDFETLAEAGKPGSHLPFPDESVTEVYSSHCLEHVRNLKGLLHEVTRVCAIGAHVTLKVPHWLSPMAMCYGHVHVLPPEQVEHWCVSAIPFWWSGSPRRLAHVSTEQVPGGALPLARRMHPGLSDEELMRVVPGAAHEVIYVSRVVNNP